MVTVPLFLLLTAVLVLLKVSAHRGHGLTWLEWALVGVWGYLAHDSIIGPFIKTLVNLATVHHP